MTAIISDKFRIFNATQFLESLSEGPTELSAERTRMYFFVGRPQRWDSYLEIYSPNSVAFVAGDEVFVGGTYGTATFKAKIRQVYPDSLLLFEVLPTALSVPPVGSLLKGYDGTSTTGAEAFTGVYRYASEDTPPVPLDNQTEKYNTYDDIIAAKRITSSYARTVIRRYNWDLVANPKYDMWKPDYSATPISGGQVGKSSATLATSIADAKFYVINSNYEVFKCLYNGESPANPTGVNATFEPKTTPSGGQGTYTAGIFSEPTNTYIWKYLFTIPTDDVLRFLSTDFMPIVETTNPSRQDVQSTAIDGSVNVAIVESTGTGLPTNGTYFAPILGDGTGGVVSVTINSAAIQSVSVVSPGSGYTYASVVLKTGTGSGATAFGLFTNVGLTTPATVASTATGAIEPIISPQGGHGSNMEEELNGKRVMLNVRLTYNEGSGDFPVDNDFRRIGIIRNPIFNGTADFATVDTLSGLYAVKISGVATGFIPDETITQALPGGTAIGTVVSWTLDSGSIENGVLKYIQSPLSHKANGIVRAFQSNGAIPIVGGTSTASGTVNTGFADGTVLLGSTFVDGLATPEIKNNSGEVIYIENRRLINRAPDQIEDIKLVIEF
jgi:hypothetical protein